MIERAVVLSTGDELVSGRVVDTNSASIADKLFALAVEVVAVLKVGDSRERILWALRQAAELGDVIIGTGGLGPTADDLTTEAVGEFLGRKLRLSEEIAEGLKKRFASRGLPWTPNNLKQALFPEGAEIVPNPLGTAPGFRVSVGAGKALFWLSGVPREMEAMLNETVLPWISEQNKTAETIWACTFKIHGLTESRLDAILRPVLLGERAKLSFRAHYPDLSLRLTVRGGEEGQKSFSELKARIESLVGRYIYAEGDETLEEVVGKLLLGKRWSLAVAESCTGGYISRRITRIAGSSVYFKGAAVAYSPGSKIRFAGVKAFTLERHGAVSQEAAREMADGIRREAGADVGLSTTGIAGPSGGSAETPVGTVWVGLAWRDRVEARLFRFGGDREHVILGASQAALNWLRTVLVAS
ncbi:MAG: competence/damage-inducible protein A [Deltaproteobacteria bacterium]|nr:competence/damage-inducible protein A [Deltaproteobacteria bacterium]